MRWRAALVPLAAVTAATLLVSGAAWGQTPEPSATETQTPAPTVVETETPEVSEAPDDPEQVVERSVKRSHKDRVEKKAKVQGGPTLLGPTKVSLFVKPDVVQVGDKVTVWGRATPEGDDKWIQIRNAATGYKIASVKTDDEGRYNTTITIRKNVPLQASWKLIKSKWKRVGAVPRLNVGMDSPLLFSKAQVSGSISKATAGKWVKVKLRRMDTGKVVDRKSVRVRGARFKAKFPIRKPGTYRALAVFDHDDWRKASSKTGKKGTPLPSLGSGSSSIFVKLLEKRLSRLGHHLQNVNSHYGQDTSDAVMAFNKVNRRARTSSVSESTWVALAKAKRPKARFSHPKFHIEVNQSKQVLYVVRKGKVQKILHVSTGAPSTPTYDGTYQFWGKIAGYSPGRLYYPSYFHGARAIHGWPSVPPYNASHGCVRVPMWAAKWIYAKVDIGDTIRIYH